MEICLEWRDFSLGSPKSIIIIKKKFNFELLFYDINVNECAWKQSNKPGQIQPKLKQIF